MNNMDTKTHKEKLSKNRSRSFRFLTDEALAKLIDDGYEELKTNFTIESTVVKMVEGLKADGYDVKIFKTKNKLKGVIYKIYCKRK
jgi:hypothetical protein